MLLHMFSSLLVAEVNLQFDLSLIMNVLFTRWLLNKEVDCWKQFGLIAVYSTM